MILVYFVEHLLEATGMRLLGLGEGLEPIGDLTEAFLSSRAGHTRVHVGVLVGLPGNCSFEVVGGGSQ